MLTTTVAGRTWSFSHAVGRNAAAGNGFTQPIAVTTAPEGVLYVLSRGQEGAGGVVAPNKRIGKLTIDQQFIGDFGREQFVWPVDLAVDADGNLYCSDEYSNQIVVFDEDGQRVGAWGEEGGGAGQLRGPAGLAFDADDNLLVVDAGNDRVQKFSKDGEFLAAFGESGSGEGQLSKPWGISLDTDGNVYVVDWGNNRVQKYSADGEHLLTFGGGGLQDGSDLDHPSNVAVDSEGDVYVVDWGNLRVQIYDPEGSVMTALYGDATEFSNWAREVVEANPDVTKAYRRVEDITPMGRFNRPVGIAVDDEDRIIVTDSTRGRLQVYVKEKDYMEPQFNL